MFNRIIIFLFALLLNSSAFAGSSTIAVTPGTAGANYDVITDASGNFVGMFGLCDGTAAASCAAVTSGAVKIAGAGTAGSPSGGLLTVQGSTASGSALASYPILIGGSDATDVRSIATNSSGQIVIVGAGTAGSGSGGVLSVQGIASGTNLPVSQATAANLNATVVGTGTFAVQATLQASATTAIGKVDPNTIGNWGLQVSTQNSSTPTNGGLVLGQFNTSPTTITSGNVSPLQLDNAGNLLVNIKAGAGSGGTALADGGTFTIGTTNETPAACTYVSGGITVTSGKSSVLSCTAAASLHTTVDNTNANGSATSANSSPVVIASDQAAVAVKAASAAFASGSIASGALASGSIAAGAVSAGAFVSGSVLSGAYASGSLASGAVVDITNMSAAIGAAAPTKALYVGTLSSGATGGELTAPITCNQHGFQHITTATDTLAVQGVTSQTIYLCAWRARAAGVATWYFENTASTNANCSSTKTQLTGVATEAANTGEVYAPTFWQGVKTTAANGLCINSTGTGGVDVDYWYAQF